MKEEEVKSKKCVTTVVVILIAIACGWIGANSYSKISPLGQGAIDTTLVENVDTQIILVDTLAEDTAIVWEGEVIE